MITKKVLFICTNNSARSQMAEDYLKYAYGEFYEVYSARTEPTTVNTFAIKVMEEIGVNISNNHSKSLIEFEGLNFDYVITVCVKQIKHVHFSPAEKNICIKALKTLHQLKEMNI